MIGHCVCWIGHCVCSIGHLVRSLAAGQTVGWVAIGQVVTCVAQTVTPGVHAVSLVAQVVASPEHWVASSGQVVGESAGHSVGVCGHWVVTTGHCVD